MLTGYFSTDVNQKSKYSTKNINFDMVDFMITGTLQNSETTKFFKTISVVLGLESLIDKSY